MNRAMRKLSIALLAGSAFAAGMVWTGELRVGQAEAVIGRPLTPVSAAGVARRSTVRATSARLPTQPPPPLQPPPPRRRLNPPQLPQPPQRRRPHPPSRPAASGSWAQTA